MELQQIEPMLTTVLNQPIRPTILLVAAVFVIAFASGFWTSRLLYQDRVRTDGERRFREFVQIADSLGIIDHGRLDEIVCIASEAEWEDADASERAVTNDAHPSDD